MNANSVPGLEMRADRLATFDFWESYTQSPLYQGELEPIKKWIRGTVLDVASDYGRFSVLSSSSVSVDIERKFLLRGADLGNISHAVAASGLALPFKDRTFETVLAMGIIDHVPIGLTPRLLDELTRVATDSGTVVIHVTSPHSPLAVVNHRNYGDYLHPYSPSVLRRQMRARGWETTGTLSSGLAGWMSLLPYTVKSYVPWSVHVTLAFRLRTAEATEPSRSSVSSAYSGRAATPPAT